MIPLRELRIGNCFIGGWGGKSYLKVTAGYLASWAKEGYLPGSFPEPNPIPLTFDILAKIGFELIKGQTEDTDCDKWIFNNFMLHFDGDDFWFGYWNMPKLTKNIAICSVHQLQNLYFALTLHELEIFSL